MTTRRAALCWLVMFVLAGAGFRLLLAVPLFVVCAALVPAACYVGLLACVDRGERPVAMQLTMLLWGAAAAAPLSRILNGVAQEWLTGVTLAVWVCPLLAAPVIEEGVKAGGFG